MSDPTPVPHGTAHYHAIVATETWKVWMAKMADLATATTAHRAHKEKGRRENTTYDAGRTTPSE